MLLFTKPITQPTAHSPQPSDNSFFSKVSRRPNKPPGAVRKVDPAPHYLAWTDDEILWDSMNLRLHQKYPKIICNHHSIEIKGWWIFPFEMPRFGSLCLESLHDNPSDSGGTNLAEGKDRASHAPENENAGLSHVRVHHSFQTSCQSLTTTWIRSRTGGKIGRWATLDESKTRD